MQENKKKANKNLNINLYWSGFYLIVIMLMTFVAYAFSDDLGALFLLVSMVVTIVFIVSTLFFRRSINKNVLNYALEVSEVQSKYIEDMSLPLVLVDALGEIRWHNKSFANVLENVPEELRSNKVIGKNIHSFITELSAEDLPAEIEGESKKQVSLLNITYDVHINLKKIDVNDDELGLVVDDEKVAVLYSMSFYDVSKEKSLAVKLDEQKSIAMLI